MMTSSARLKPVHGFAERKEQDAARAFGESQQKLQSESDKLEQLRHYRREYMERFHSVARQGIQARRVLDYQAFIAKLDEAIGEQEKMLGYARETSHRAKDQWMEKQSRSKALGKVVERHQVRERQEMDKREQREQDERSQHGRPLH
ncbi:MAG: flagellar export protein FliJ [Gammaproteobacteria bacterium SHHR-1]|uniref:flagellar export protein FliJ n=1 Tax=Magnetovirga frankeli TaxID=947516 RepID=UPI00129383F0|nr:flagellar export protein FliJ [gamma proteobacterium SS-5]